MDVPYLFLTEYNGKEMQIRCLLRSPSSDPRPWSLGEELDNKEEKQCMALATYAAEDGLVGHQWEERPWDLSMFDTPV